MECLTLKKNITNNAPERKGELLAMQDTLGISERILTKYFLIVNPHIIQFGSDRVRKVRYYLNIPQPQTTPSNVQNVEECLTEKWIKKHINDPKY